MPTADRLRHGNKGPSASFLCNPVIEMQGQDMVALASYIMVRQESAESSIANFSSTLSAL